MENSWYIPWLLFLGINMLIALLLLAGLLIMWFRRTPTEHQPLLLTEDRTNEWKKAFSEVLPMLAYPIVIYSTYLVSYVYQFIAFNAYNQALVLTLQCVLWSILSSTSLLIHMIVVKCLRRKLRHSLGALKNKTPYLNFQTDENTYTASTNYNPTER